MPTRTDIQWTQSDDGSQGFTSNPIRARRKNGKQRIDGHYCEKIAAGCANCYASKWQPRYGMPEFPGANGAYTGVEPYLNEVELQKLLNSRAIRGKRIFMCDMTDMFGHWVPDEWLDKLFAVFALLPDTTFQILTKRPERMAAYCANRDLAEAANRTTHEFLRRLDGPLFLHGEICLPLPNVWLGCSVATQKDADTNIPHLLRCPAAVRFVSVEPMLGPVDFSQRFDLRSDSPHSHEWRDPLNGAVESESPTHGRRSFPSDGIHWVICGGESGHNARPFNIDWARSLRDQCKAAGVPFFMKQLGAKPHGIDLIDRHGGDMEEWPEDLRVREFPKEAP